MIVSPGTRSPLYFTRAHTRPRQLEECYDGETIDACMLCAALRIRSPLPPPSRRPTNCHQHYFCPPSPPFLPTTTTAACPRAGFGHANVPSRAITIVNLLTALEPRLSTRRFCGLRNGAMRYRCCVLIGMFLLLVGAGVGGYFGYKKYSSLSSSSSSSDDDCSSYKNKHLCDSSAMNATSVGPSPPSDGSVDTTGSDSERRDTDKAGDGADSLPAGGANTGEWGSVEELEGKPWERASTARVVAPL